MTSTTGIVKSLPITRASPRRLRVGPSDRQKYVNNLCGRQGGRCNKRINFGSILCADLVNFIQRSAANDKRNKSLPPIPQWCQSAICRQAGDPFLTLGGAEAGHEQHRRE